MSSQFLLRRVTIVWYQNLTDQRVEGALAYASIQELISLQCPKSHIAQNKNNKVRQGKPCKKDSRIVNLQTSFSTQTSGKTRIKESLGRLDAIEESLLLQCLGVMFSCRNDQLPAAVERDGLRWLRIWLIHISRGKKKSSKKGAIHLLYHRNLGVNRKLHGFNKVTGSSPTARPKQFERTRNLQVPRQAATRDRFEKLQTSDLNELILNLVECHHWEILSEMTEMHFANRRLHLEDETLHELWTPLSNTNAIVCFISFHGMSTQHKLNLAHSEPQKNQAFTPSWGHGRESLRSFEFGIKGFIPII